MPKMDYSKLLGRMKEKGYTQKSVAGEIGVSESHLCQKMAGRYVFTQKDIQNICDLLDINGEDIGTYFFTPILEESQVFDEKGA